MRVWRAFCRGFWAAWMEVPPASARSVGEMTVILSCDDSGFQRTTNGVIARLREIQRLTPPHLRGN